LAKRQRSYADEIYILYCRRSVVGSTVIQAPAFNTPSDPPLSFRAVLQNHYPNRLHSAYFRNMSPIMASFLPCTYPFLDPRTRAKFKVDADPLEDGIVEKSQLLKEWGGDAVVSWIESDESGDSEIVYADHARVPNVQFEPDHPGFYEELKRQHAAWKAKSMDRWRKLGSHIGANDLLLRETGDEDD
jgi:hypothetical protein